MNSSDERAESAIPILTLFVASDAPRSRRARANLATALEKLGQQSVSPLEVDLLERPEQSVSHSIFATPALLRTGRDGAINVIYGDLSDESKLLHFLADLTNGD